MKVRAMPNAEERPHNPSPFIREEAKKLAESSRRGQGLAPRITDPVVLGKVAAALTAPLTQAEEDED